MKFTWDIALFIFLIQFFGYIIKWVIGFGNPLVSAPLLSMRLDNALITPGSLVPDFCINTYISWKSRKLLDLRQILPLLIVLLAGVIPGTWLLRFSMPWVIKTVLGIVVLFLGLEMATRNLRPVRPGRKDHPAVRYLVVFFSGVCAGLFGINLFLVAYLQRTTKNYDEFKGSICFLFWGENLFRIILYTATGLLDAASLQFSVISMVSAMLALGAAKPIIRRVKSDTLQRLAIVFFLLGGISIIIKSLLTRT